MELVVLVMLVVAVLVIVSIILSFARLPRRSGMRVTVTGAFASLIGISLLIAAGVARQEPLTVAIIGLATLAALVLLLIGAFAGFEKISAPDSPNDRLSQKFTPKVR
ncbi:MAG: hypothetical protein HY421_03100 [Candidatus Kerfeldbacteria bacterium]|nr:hypothetical protein [Candidatus Kerfeldbacteria bacterium]